MDKEQIKLNDNEREDWINNYEPLYRLWQGSRKGIAVFIRENRKEITDIIVAQLSKKPRS